MEDCVSLGAITSPTELGQLKRKQLQKLCKKLGLKANGKNVDLISRLSECIQATPADETISYSLSPLVLKEAASPPRKGASPPQGEEQLETEGDSGWCVVHGVEIAGRAQVWSSLIPKSGKFLVADGDALVPLHLTPAAVETPPYLEDNRICEECVKLNRIKDSMVQIPTSRRQSGLSNSSSRKRSGRGVFGRYFPREDKGYATKVENLLLKIENGDVTVDQAIGSGQQKVLNSPKC